MIDTTNDKVGNQTESEKSDQTKYARVTDRRDYKDPRRALVEGARIRHKGETWKDAQQPRRRPCHTGDKHEDVRSTEEKYRCGDTLRNRDEKGGRRGNAQRGSSRATDSH